MLNALKPQYRQYRTAFWVVDGNNVSTKKMFRYAIVSEQEKTFYQPVRNMLTNVNSFAISTNFMFDFNSQDQIWIGTEQFIIKKAIKIVKNINEQALAVVKDTVGTYWVLELE
jgi:hypothetical protein